MGELIYVTETLSNNKKLARIYKTETILMFDKEAIADNSINFKYKYKYKVGLQNYKKNEIMISHFILSSNYCDHPIYDNYNYRDHDKEVLVQFLEDTVSQLNNEKYSNLYYFENRINPKIKYYFRKFPNDFIKKIFKYYYKDSGDGITKNEKQEIIRQIATSKRLSKHYKKKFISAFLYLKSNRKIEDYSKEDFLNFILEVVRDYSKQKIPGDPGPREIDQKALAHLFRGFKNNLITLKDLYRTSNRILDIDKNPTVTMLAYRNIVYYFLEIGDFERALQTTIASIKKYDIPILWVDYKAPRYYNAIPAIAFINYIYDNGIIQSDILEYLEEMKQASVELKVMTNFINFCIARETEFSNYTTTKVLNEYKNINTETETYYQFGKSIGTGRYGNSAFYRSKNKITELENFKPYNVKTLSDSVNVKMHILANNSEQLYQKKGTELLIIQETPDYLKWNKESCSWYKALHNGNIYWVNIEDIKQY